MKRCPRCDRTYSDPLEYCIDDGSHLVYEPDPEATVVSRHAHRRTSPTFVRYKKRRSHRFGWLVLACLLAVIVGAGAVVLNNELRQGDSESSPQPSNATVGPFPPAATPQATVQLSNANVPVNTQSPSSQVGAQSLNGKWELVNTVEHATMPEFKNLQLGYRLLITQNGNRFRADGEKFSENGKTLPASARTAIHVTGSVNGENVVGSFAEEGARRNTSGRLTWHIDEDGKLTGTFSSTAASSRGSSVATKVQP